MTSELFRNAVASIRMGVEDYRSQDVDRNVSAVRNYYAGLLLLAKEVLVQRFPNEDPDILLATKVRPVSEDGKLVMKPEGTATVDFASIGQRLKDFDIAIDVVRIKELRKIRNDLEHKYSSATPNAMKRAIARGFPVIAEMFSLLGVVPAHHLEGAWTMMLETAEVYEAELHRARLSLHPIRWYSPTFSRAALECPECDSGLIFQLKAGNSEQDKALLACHACGIAILAIEDFIEATLDKELGADGHIRAMEGGDGPLYECPSCDRLSFVDFENICAACGFKVPEEAGRCQICWEVIPLGELLQDSAAKLCSYHRYVAEKDD